MNKKEVFNFYKSLFSSKENNITKVNLNEILNEDTPKLTDQQARTLEGEITFNEAGIFL